MFWWTFHLAINSFLLQFNGTGAVELWFVFQKMKYVYDAEEKKQFQLIEFPVHNTFHHYIECKGFAEDDDIKQAEWKFGGNV